MTTTPYTLLHSNLKPTRRQSMRAVMMAASLVAGATGTAYAQSAPAVAPAPTASQPPASTFERDRQAILSQAGQFRVHFDMRETVSFDADYDPLEEKLSGGSEIVRVVYDQGDRISLQHILVMEHDGQTVVVKHWRQDWAYQPRAVLTYAGPNQWKLQDIPADERVGAWSQTVWQTDDSPRYGGYGHWTYDNGLTQWTSNQTWRPLARRDAVRNPVYDRYLGVNRHILRPTGWVHIQDNMKMSGRNGAAPVAIVQEDVVNTYDPSTSYNPKPGDDYWAATQEFWAGIRATWDAVAARDGGIYVEETPETGASTGIPLMELAQKIQDGELSTEAALIRGREIISAATSPR